MSEQLILSDQDFISVPKRLYIKKIKKEYWVIYNPDSYSAPILSEKNVVKVLLGLKNDKLENILPMFKNMKYLRNIIENLILNNIILLNNEYYLKAISGHVKNYSIWLHITNRCNLRCPYCYINKDDKSDMSDNVIYGAIDNLLEQAEKYNIKNVRIKFSGGEPMLRFDKIKEIIEFYKKNNNGIFIRYAIITNGTIVSEEIINFIKKEKIEISISMDGDKKYFNKTRIYSDGSGCFDKVMENIHLFKAMGIKPYILVTISSKNMRGLPSFTKLALREGLGFRFSIFKDYNCADKTLIPNKRRLITIMKKCYSIMKRNPPNFDLGRIHLNGINIYNPGSCGCAIGRYSSVINWNGEISLCQLIMDKPISNYKNGVISSVKNQKQFNLRYQKKDIQTDCTSCFWENVCGGNCPLSVYQYSGNFFGISPNCMLFKNILPVLVDTIGFQMYKDIRRR